MEGTTDVIKSGSQPHPPAQTQAWPYLANEAFMVKLLLKKYDHESDHFLREHPALYLTAHSFELVKALV